MPTSEQSGRVVAPEQHVNGRSFDDVEEEVVDEVVEEPQFVEDKGEELSHDEAESALAVMLRSEPQELPTEAFVVTRLKMRVVLRGMSEREIDAIGRRSERVPNKAEKARGVTQSLRDMARFNLLLASTAMLDPDLSHPGLRERFGARPEDVVKAWFLPGEIIQMADKVMDLSGYSDEAVVQAGKS